MLSWKTPHHPALTHRVDLKQVQLQMRLAACLRSSSVWLLAVISLPRMIVFGLKSSMLVYVSLNKKTAVCRVWVEKRQHYPARQPWKDPPANPAKNKQGPARVA